LLNVDALAAAGSAAERGAQNGGDILLHVGEIGDELETENVPSAFGGSCGQRC